MGQMLFVYVCFFDLSHEVFCCIFHSVKKVGTMMS